MTSISISLEEEVVEFLDQLVKKGVIASRSDAVRGGLYAYVKERIGIRSREELRHYLKKKQMKPFLPGTEAIRSVRNEEDI